MQTRTLAVIGLVCAACADFGQSMAADPASMAVQERSEIKKDAGIPALLDKIGDRENWYGVYFQSHKIGHAVMEVLDHRSADPPSVDVVMRMTMQMDMGGELLTMQMDEQMSFDGSAPYRMRTNMSESRQDDDRERITLTREGDAGSYLVEITQAGSTRKRTLDCEYTLSDQLGMDLWLAGQPVVGDTHKGQEFNLNDLKVSNLTSTIKERNTSRLNGVLVTDYVIESVSEDGLRYELQTLADGTVITAQLAELLELRLEPEAIARKLDEPRDLFVDMLVPVEGQLEAHSAQVTRLVLEVTPEFGKAIGNAPGQVVIPPRPAGDDQESSRYRIMLSSNNARDVRAEPEDSRKALLATVEFPARHPEVLALAQKAVGDAGSPHEKVRRLVGFVDEFVADTYSVEPLSVLDIIQQKAGDCSVHSALFTAMARSVGIPTRTVGGLICGELVPGEGLVFGWHAWNEVVLDGFWVPVDATWNETTTNATHIRFPVVEGEEFAAVSKLQNARIEIIEAQAKP